jgi:hypothetical protein
MPASGDAAASILDRVAKLSAAFGTKLSVVDGRGVVSVHDAGTSGGH